MTDTTHYCPGCFKYRGEEPVCIFCSYDTHEERSPLFLPHHTLLAGQFVIGRALGEPGGFGVTYLAWDQVLGTTVAVKEYLPREFAGRSANETRIRSHTSRDEELFEFGRQRFIEEARTLAQLQHSNVVRVRHVFSANDTTYLVMDFYEGLNLEQFHGQQGEPLEERPAVEVTLAVLDGLRHVHERGFLHRDVKPANIYLATLDAGNYRPILLDFGSARVALGEKSRSMDVVLTQGYAPIEQYYEKGHQGPWTDVYSVAATLYWLLTGETPPEAAARVQDDQLVAPSERRPEVSDALSEVVVAGLGVLPEDRPQSVLAFQEMLLDAVPDLVTQSVEEIIPPAPVEPRRRGPSPWLAAGAAVLVAGSLGLSGWLWANGNQPPVAVDDRWSLRPMGKIRLDVLDNDNDPDTDSLHVSQLNEPLHGSIQLEMDGSVGYTPAANYAGPDRFSYWVSDGEQERRGEVTLQMEKTRMLVWAGDPPRAPEVKRIIDTLRSHAPGRSELRLLSRSDLPNLKRLLETHHTFIMPPQLDDDQALDIQALGREMGPLLEPFVERGGNLIALCDQDFLAAGGLMGIGARGFTVSGGDIVKSTDASVVRGLPPRFDTAKLTCSYQLADSEAQVLAQLNGQAVIAVRPLGEGQIVLNGFSYGTDYGPMNQVLVNAAFGPQGILRRDES